MKHLVVILGEQGPGKSLYAEQMYRGYMRWIDGTQGYLLRSLITKFNDGVHQLVVMPDHVTVAELDAVVQVGQAHGYVVDVVALTGKTPAGATSLNIHRWEP